MKAGYDHPMRSAAAVADGLQHGVLRHGVPSLDGLRAVSIALVVLSHTKSLVPASVAHSGLFRYVIGGGLHGVQIFFVISGYLITTLLLREFESTGGVSMRHFYARRALRIFPPFYLFLGVVVVLWIAGIQTQDASTFLSAATYMIVYYPNPQGWMLQHTWSLSIEEQFYLLWPAVFVFAWRRGVAARAAIAILIAMPIARGIIAFAATARAMDHLRLIVNMSAIDTLMAGCLLAMLAKNIRWRRWCERWMMGWCAVGALVIGFIVVPYAQAKLAGTELEAYGFALGYSATALAIGTIVAYLVRAPQSIAGRVLNFSPVRHLGVISYSIYLWQQAFTNNPTRFGLWTYALILLVAEGSFWLVERPLMRVRARFKPNHYPLDRAEFTSSAARVSVSGVSPNASIQ